MIRQVFQSPLFERQKKRLSGKDIAALDREIRCIQLDPTAGEAKKGDLAGVYVHKYKEGVRLMLIAYEFEKNEILLLALGSHEKFYRDLKKYIK
ncbi:MAG: type II toxin-antitoxin system RelE/ParE family toxin [Syntrophales bacterium]|nr:type II toxin-antitoxin system RelE/ParE family toxin [Syntrophales bacterium]MDD5531622.1 type II toxin-antitoxin system RelE/ParE family toxin [Syntrophales bacterium]